MYDPDIIDYLFPVEGKGRDGARVAINMPLNRSRFAPSRRRDNLLELAHETESRSVGEPTEVSDEECDYDHEPCLVLRFSNPLKSRQGLVAEKSLEADIVLPMSRRQLVPLRADFRPTEMLDRRAPKNTESTGALVDGGPSLLQSKVPIIKIVGDLRFKLVVPNHNGTSQTYLDNVAQFLQGTAPTENLFSNLKIISCTRTELPTPALHLARQQLGRPMAELGFGAREA
ncbi:hypothetical protein MMC29_008394 [Sticta canariensis]|nr:hypothetical protein [Sticta canariensis]